MEIDINSLLIGVFIGTVFVHLIFLAHDYFTFKRRK